MHVWNTDRCRKISLFLLPALLLCLILALTACSDDDDDVGPTGPDTTRPQVTAVSPAAGATDVPVDAVLTVTFSEEIDIATLGSGSIVLNDQGPLPKATWKAAGTRQLVYIPNEPFEYDNRYEAIVDSALADLAGNTMAADFEWSFSTASFPLAEIDFPLARDNTWLYQIVEFSRVGSDTTHYEGVDVLWAEDEITWDGRDGWLLRRFMLDETATGAPALQEDFCYLSLDASGLYRARPLPGGGTWRNLVVFGQEEFEDSDFLLAGRPQFADGSTHRAVRYAGPVGDAWADEVDYQFVEPGEVAERMRESYVNGFGLVESSWQYANIDSQVDINGHAELADAANGPITPWIEREIEPNDAPGAQDAQIVELTTIALGDIHLTDGGTILTPEDIDCDFFTCVLEDIEGVRILQDFYRVDITERGQYRFDLIYDLFDGANDLDLYCFVDEGGGSLRSVARADADAGVPEYIVLLDATPGTYYVALQAWNTPVPQTPVAYTLSLRPQVTYIPPPVKSSHPGFLASRGK